MNPRIFSWTSAKDWLQAPGDSTTLALFRIAFGSLMAYVIIHYFQIGLIKNMFVLPLINFKYDYLHWLIPLPEAMMNVIMGILLISALAMATGTFFKWACWIFALGLAYIFLLDKSIYNNHIYLFILLPFLLSFTPADQKWALRWPRQRTVKVMNVHLLILQAQILIVYFFGGIAKLKPDWLLHCQPIKTFAHQLAVKAGGSSFLESDLVIYLLNYGGLLIDLGAPCLLLISALRKFSVWIYIAFNILNAVMFSDIGVFPFVMCASLILFFRMERLPFFVTEKKHTKAELNQKKLVRSRDDAEPFFSKPSFYILSLYFIFQLLLPLRGYFLPNDEDYTTIGNRFSWRMKVDTRETSELKFTIYSPSREGAIPVDVQTFINDMQMLNLSMDPRSVADFAKFLKKEAEKYDTKDPVIKASIKVSYNGRPDQYFVDPETDLSSVSYNPLKVIPWLIPIKDKL